MFLRYLYDEKLAQASYFVGCPATNEAIVIDPARHIAPYLELARQQGLKITAVTETHIHADFVSGARELAEQTGATLLLSGEGGEDWQYTYLEDYPHALLHDGDVFEIGNLTFDVWHTPGHTPEHLSFLLTDGGADEPFAIFTGDFVFAGDLGRPDLLEKAANQAGTATALAQQMYQSVQRFNTLADYIQVFPGHGAGSACGKSLGAVPSTTVGYEKRFNPMLNIAEKADFVTQLLDGQTRPPNYFAIMKQVNKAGPKLLADADRADNLPPIVLRNALESGATIVDTRARQAFAQHHLRGTINIEHTASFPGRAGDLIDYEQPFYVIADDAHTVKRDLQSVGLDNLAGTFRTSVFSTIERTSDLPFDSYTSHSPTDVAPRVAQGEIILIDVRNPHEWEAGHVEGAQNIPLGELQTRLTELPQDQPVAVYCQTGVRSAVAASILRANGFDTIDVDGGYTAWEVNKGHPQVDT